tara:strand:+ start:275 stop:436 length:162 start_codon:yes stop_codon:yes gene_type:complete
MNKPRYKMEKSKTYKWAVSHIDDCETETKWFRTKDDAIFEVMMSSGFTITKEE